MEKSQQISSIIESLKQPRPMNTVKNYFEKFPSPYKEQALANTKKAKYLKLTDTFPCAFIALEEAFDWAESPEKQDYWMEFHDKLIVNKFVPKNQPIFDWYDTYPEPYNTQAKKNATDYLTSRSIAVEGRMAVTPSQAITSSFGFSGTPEGTEYWNHFVSELQNMEKEQYYKVMTVKDWFESIEEPHRSLALANLNSSNAEKHVTSLTSALNSGFKWDDAKEGRQFWNTFTNEMSKNGR